MIRHVSVFKLKEEYKIDGIKKLIELLEETSNECDLIQNSLISENITNVPMNTGEDTPLFGDVIQMIDFKDHESSMAYPTSIEHMKLLEESKDMIEIVTAIDFLI